MATGNFALRLWRLLRKRKAEKRLSVFVPGKKSVGIKAFCMVMVIFLDMTVIKILERM